jgi:hypothetical protein
MAEPYLALRHREVDTFIILIDPSHIGICETLRQVQLILGSKKLNGEFPESEEQILEYFSRMFYSAEMCYRMYDKELLAITEARKED